MLGSVLCMCVWFSTWSRLETIWNIRNWLFAERERNSHWTMYETEWQRVLSERNPNEKTHSDQQQLFSLRIRIRTDEFVCVRFMHSDRLSFQWLRVACVCVATRSKYTNKTSCLKCRHNQLRQTRFIVRKIWINWRANARSHLFAQITCRDFPFIRPFATHLEQSNWLATIFLQNKRKSKPNIVLVIELNIRRWNQLHANSKLFTSPGHLY